jgi:hypothetical protein
VLFGSNPSLDMKDTYRLSDRLARRQLLLSSGMTLAVLVYMSVKWYREGAGYSAVCAITFVVALGKGLACSCLANR